MHDGEAERAFCRFARLGYPNPAYGVDGCVEVHGGEELQSLWWRQVSRAIDSGGLFPGVFLRDPAHCEAFRTPGRGEEFLESVGFLRLSTDRCLGDSSLELEHLHLELPPGDGVPFIPMMCIMAHDVWTLLVDSPFVSTVPLWAYPSHCRGLWLRGRSLHTSRLRVCVGLLSGESVRGFPSPWVTCGALGRVSLSAGCRCGWRRQACNFLQLWPGLRTMTLGIIVVFGPSFSWSLTRVSLVQLV